MKISACVIAKNEEKNIARCINSYKEVADEIIVVDTGSDDRTVEIAKELGARVYYFKWINDFAAAKNFAISKARGDWIIFLDADEYFADGTARNIPRLIKKCEQSGAVIIACKMMNIDIEKGTNIADFVQGRVFKNNRDICYTSPIHERLCSRKKKNLKAIYAEEKELFIYHTGYSGSGIVEKARRNLELLLKEVEKPEPDPSAYFFISDAYLTLKEYEKSIYYAELFLKNKVNLTGLNSKVYQNIISAMVELKYDEQKIENVIREARDNFPQHPIFQLYLAQSYHRRHKYKAALAAYEQTIEMQNVYNDFEINFITGRVYEIDAIRADLFYLMNQEDKALEACISALKQKKDYHPALKKLLMLIKDWEDERKIMFLNQIYDQNDKSDMAILLEKLTKERYGKVLIYYATWMYKNFGHQDFSLVVAFLLSGKYDKAFKHFYEAYLTEYDNSYAKLAVISAYLYNNPEMLQKIGEAAKPSLKRIVRILTGEDSIQFLSKEDLQDYIDLLVEILKIGKKKHLEEFLSLRENFQDEIENLDAVIGDILKENFMYEEAIAQYEKALLKGKNAKQILFHIGYCYYKLRDFTRALEYWEQAWEKEYKGDDLQDFLTIIYEQAESEKTKQLAREIAGRCDALCSD